MGRTKRRGIESKGKKKEFAQTIVSEDTEMGNRKGSK